jgi:hypothetical protein
MHPIFGEDGYYSPLVRGEDVADDRGDIGAVQQNHNLIGDCFFRGAD